ncbi:MAG: hypothetical protein FJW37_05870 [Acidobacteria bacterium]|nr:hypothetical protein [Acidobacteriota bacterium]
MKRSLAVAVFLAAGLSSSTPDYFSVKRKFEAIEKQQLKPGTRMQLSEKELNAYFREEAVRAVPEGLSQPRLELGEQQASGSAVIDFVKLQKAQGKPPGWLMAQLLAGEHTVKVTARIQSGAGRATVNPQSVEIDGIAISGPMLNYLIENYLLPRYPTAAINRPFELGHRIERLDVRPSSVAVVIGR